MTKHFDLLPEPQRDEALELHKRRKRLSSSEKRRYLWLSRKALFLYGVRGCT